MFLFAGMLCTYTIVNRCAMTGQVPKSCSIRSLVYGLNFVELPAAAIA